MFLLGTIINTIAILFGGIVGHYFGHYLNQDHQDGLTMASGISILFIGISGAMSGMLKLSSHHGLSSGQSMLVVACLALGALFGEVLGIEARFENFGDWIKLKSGNANDNQFVNSFVTASLTVCIGAMAILGPIQNALNGDISLLVTKSVLDFIIIMIMTTSLGKGCVFSAFPVFLFEGSIAILSRLLQPLLTSEAIANIALIGSILIFCVGLNLIFGKRIKVANLLPAIIFAAFIAYLNY